MELFTTEWTNPFTGKAVQKTRLFIPSKVSDNKYLDDNYVANLHQVGSAELVRAWLEGDWSVVEGSFFPEFSGRNIIDPFPIPPDWLRFRSMDWGSARPFSADWWAVASDDYALTDGRVIPRGALVHYRSWYGSSSPNVGLSSWPKRWRVASSSGRATSITLTPCSTRACLRRAAAHRFRNA